MDLFGDFYGRSIKDNVGVDEFKFNY
jgi:hypothetical protein